MPTKKSFFHPDYLRSALFGIEDALVSTTGVVVGVSTGVEERSVILLAAFVTVAVEALSMSAGQYLSEEAVHEMAKKKHTDSLWIGAAYMFAAYFLAGLIPVVPLFFFSYPISSFYSIGISLTGLFVLGYLKGKVVRVPAFKSALKMLIIGGLAVLLGSAVGHVFKL